MEHHLSDEERARAAAQVDHFISLMETRWGISAIEAADLLRWARAQRDRNAKLAQGGALSLIGLVVTALAISLVEGVKAFFTGGR